MFGKLMQNIWIEGLGTPGLGGKVQQPSTCKRKGRKEGKEGGTHTTHVNRRRWHSRIHSFTRNPLAHIQTRLCLSIPPLEQNLDTCCTVFTLKVKRSCVKNAALSIPLAARLCPAVCTTRNLTVFT